MLRWLPKPRPHVAVKIILASFAADPNRLHRFEQEAALPPPLNHPNVLAVHDIGTHEGCSHIVSELLEAELCATASETARWPTANYALRRSSSLAGLGPMTETCRRFIPDARIADAYSLKTKNGTDF
jgi:serine/threonine protein kinase